MAAQHEGAPGAGQLGAQRAQQAGVSSVLPSST